MGTRADFYVGRGRDAEWLGSVTWDGYPGGFDTRFWLADTESQYRGAIMAVAEERDDWTRPDEGWPWPWETSRTSDYAYAFDDGVVYAASCDYWWPMDDDAEYLGDYTMATEDKFDYRSDEYKDAILAHEANLERVNYPDMSERRMSNADVMSRSGLIVFTTQGEAK